MFGALYASEGSSTDALVGVAAEFSPRYEVTGPRDVTLDLSGLARLFGSARAIADELQRTAAERGLHVPSPLPARTTAARLLARGSRACGSTRCRSGEEAACAGLTAARTARERDERERSERSERLPNRFR